jgi:hypothetical protein
MPRTARDARREFGAGKTAGVYVVVRHDNRIIRSAFIDDSGIRDYESD